MMPRGRIHQVVLVASLVWISWLGMMLVHESGHALAAVCTGGHVQRLVWHPLVLSRTDVQPNPSPLIVVWGGPIIGSVVPLLFVCAAIACRWRIAYMFVFFAGFCALANGVYIGACFVAPVGDAHEMLRLGSPRWLLVVFGLITTVLGVRFLDRASSRLGFGSKPATISEHDAYGLATAAIILTSIGLVIGNRGG